MQDVAIAEADHPVALLAQPSGARPIILLLLGVPVAVDLHHKVAGWAAEIYHKWADWHLPPELESTKLPVTEVCPKTALERGLLTA